MNCLRPSLPGAAFFACRVVARFVVRFVARFVSSTDPLHYAAVQKEGCFLYRGGLWGHFVQKRGCFLYGTASWGAPVQQKAVFCTECGS